MNLCKIDDILLQLQQHHHLMQSELFHLVKRLLPLSADLNNEIDI